MDLQIYNGTHEDLTSKRNNIYIGVSISLKPYSEKLARQYLRFVLDNTKDNVGILFADDLAALNYRYLDKYSWARSLRKARNIGNERYESYSKLVEELSSEEQKKIQMIRWADINDSDLEEKITIIENETDKDLELREALQKPLKYYLKKRGRTITQKRLEKLSRYVTSELPLLLDGVEFGGINYKTMLYPTWSNTTLAPLAANIQHGKQFPRLKERLGLKGDHILIDSQIPINY